MFTYCKCQTKMAGSDWRRSNIYMEIVYDWINEVEGGWRRSNIYMEQLCDPWAKVAPWHICSSSYFISSDLDETAILLDFG